MKHPKPFFFLPLILACMHLGAQVPKEIASFPLAANERLIAVEATEEGWAGISRQASRDNTSYFFWTFDKEFKQKSRKATGVSSSDFEYPGQVQFNGKSWFITREVVEGGLTAKAQKNRIYLTRFGTDGSVEDKEVKSYSVKDIKKLLERDNRLKHGFFENASGMMSVRTALSPKGDRVAVGYVMNGTILSLWCHGDHEYLRGTTVVDLAQQFGPPKGQGYYSLVDISLGEGDNICVSVQEIMTGMGDKQMMLFLSDGKVKWKQKIEESKTNYWAGVFFQGGEGWRSLQYSNPAKGKTSAQKTFRLYDVSPEGLEMIDQKTVAIKPDVFNHLRQAHRVNDKTVVLTASAKESFNAGAGNTGSSSFNNILSVVVKDDKIASVLSTDRRIQSFRNAGLVLAYQDGNDLVLRYGSLPNEKSPGANAVKSGYMMQLSATNDGTGIDKVYEKRLPGFEMGLSKRVDGNWILFGNTKGSLKVYR